MNLIFFGAPGVGKGTQAEKLAERLGIPHISTGTIFRAALEQKKELGLKAKEYMDRGALVPDDLTTAIVVDAFSQPKNSNGFILDGYPRNLSQAKALETALRELGKEIDNVIYLTAPKEEIVQRMLSRGRTDDTEDVINHRLDVYRSETEPVLIFYQNFELVTEVYGVGTIDEVHERVVDAVKVNTES
ncbi:MAG: adenylate kinase [Chlorobi bacterium]|nr:adenylate kinase [Chlorobiota bacterium]